MTCDDVRRIDMLTDYLGGLLSADTVADYERHLERCSPCAKHVSQYQKVTCREFILDLLDDYLDGGLGANVAVDLERHLAICPACVAYLNTYRKTRALVAREAQREMPEEMRALLLRFLRERLRERLPRDLS